MAERSKTKSKILSTALTLFNEEGESQVSAVDVASVIDISPGNLYYHYKGKDEIIAALFEDFEEEIRIILAGPMDKPLPVSDYWVYFYIIFEELYDFRFFYRNISAILLRNPQLQGRFSRILSYMETTAFALLDALEKQSCVEFADGEKGALSARLAQHFTFWISYHDLRYGEEPPKSLIDQGAITTLMQIVPYWRDDAAAHLPEFLEGQGES